VQQSAKVLTDKSNSAHCKPRWCGAAANSAGRLRRGRSSQVASRKYERKTQISEERIRLSVSSQDHKQILNLLGSLFT